MSRSVFPSSIILSHFPRLAELYNPFFSAIKQGNVKAYDDALIRGRRRLVDMGSWFSVEKSREVCVRGLFKIVWVFEFIFRQSSFPLFAFTCCSRAKTETNYHQATLVCLLRWIASDKSSRIPIASFQLAMSLQGVETELDEVECMVANMIYNVSQKPRVWFMKVSIKRHRTRIWETWTALSIFWFFWFFLLCCFVPAGIHERIHIAFPTNGRPGQNEPFSELEQSTKSCIVVFVRESPSGINCLTNNGTQLLG